MQPADYDLLKQTAKGDQQAAALLINRHSPRVLSLAERMLGSREDAEDITQEVFIKVFREAPHWKKGRAKFTSWLHKVTLNQCYDRLRKHREKLMDEPPEQIDTAPGPAGQMNMQQRQERLKQALANLPDRQRAAILLNHYEELSNKETADILDISIEAVESLLSRARRGLRAALREDRDILLGEV